MIEAYAIGISLAIESNPIAELRAIGEQFDLLTQTIQRTQTAAKDLSGALTGIEGMGGAAARAWAKAADAIERAAAAAKRAGAARPGSDMMPPAVPPPPPSAGPSPGAPPVPPAGPLLPPSQSMSRAVVPYTPPGLPTPYVSPETSFNLQGQPYMPYSGYPPAAPFRPAPSGGSLVPWLAAGAGGAGGREPPNFTTQGGPYDAPGRYPPPARYEGRERGELPPLSVPPGLMSPTRGPMPGGHDLAMSSIGFGAISGMLLSGVKTTINAAMSVDEIRANLINQGFSPKQADKAVEESRQIQVSTPGSSMKGNLEIISKGMAITQNPEQAMQLLPPLARFGVALDAFNQGKEGAALMDALLAGDFRGIFQKINPKTGKEEFDLAALIPFLQNVATADFQTHGIINPGRILQYLRSGGAAARIISDESLFADSLALQMAMGSSKAGTGLNALAQQFSSFKMSNAALTMLQEMHVVKDFDIKHPPKELGRKLGFGQFQLMPEAFNSPDAYEQARNDPTGFVMDYIGPRLQQWVMTAYQQQIAHHNLSEEEKQKLLHEDLLATWPALTSRIPGGKLGAEVEGNYPLILRDRDARMRMLGYDPETKKRVGPPRDFYDLSVKNNPEIQVKSFSAALESLEYVLGERLMKSATDSLNDISSALNAFAESADKHKDLTRWLMDGGVAIGALAGGLGLLTGALFLLKPMGSVFKWLAPGLFDAAGAFKLFAPGTAAAAGMGVLGKSLGALAGLFSAFELSKGVKSATDSASDWVTTQGLGVDPKKLDAIKQFDIFDRSTWRDPNAHWWQAAPKLPGQMGPDNEDTPSAPSAPEAQGGLLQWFHNRVFGPSKPSASQEPSKFHAGTAAGVYAPALDMLARSEGTDKGRGYNETLSYGKFTGGPVNLTNMTIAQVEALQAQMIANHAPSTAVGRYQIIDTTLKDLTNKLHIDPNTTKFTSDVQDQMGIALLRQAGVDDYRAGRLSQNDLMHNVSRIWASVPDPAKGGVSHYAGQRAGIGMDDAAAQLNATKNLADQIAPSLPPIGSAPANDTGTPRKRADNGPLSWLIPSAQAETLPPAAPAGSPAASLLDTARPIPHAANDTQPFGGNLATLSAAPASVSQSAGQSGPIPVRVVNGRDLAQGVTNHIADQITKPPSGPTQPNLRLTPGYPSSIPAFGGS